MFPEAPIELFIVLSSSLCSFFVFFWACGPSPRPGGRELRGTFFAAASCSLVVVFAGSAALRLSVLRTAGRVFRFVGSLCFVVLVWPLRGRGGFSRWPRACFVASLLHFACGCAALVRVLWPGWPPLCGGSFRWPECSSFRSGAAPRGWWFPRCVFVSTVGSPAAGRHVVLRCVGRVGVRNVSRARLRRAAPSRSRDVSGKASNMGVGGCAPGRQAPPPEEKVPSS